MSGAKTELINTMLKKGKFPAYNLSTKTSNDDMKVTGLVKIKSYKTTKDKEGTVLSKVETGKFRYVIKGTGLNKKGEQLAMSAIVGKDTFDLVAKTLKLKVTITEPKGKAPRKKRSTKSCEEKCAEKKALAEAKKEAKAAKKKAKAAEKKAKADAKPKAEKKAKAAAKPKSEKKAKAAAKPKSEKKPRSSKKTE